MSSYPIRKRATGTSREVAELRAVFERDPGYFGTPLARALSDLSHEYSAIGNYQVARRHMNASLKAMQFALDDPAIDDHRRRSVVEFLWQSAGLHYRMGNLEKALRDVEEAIRWDLATWESHEYCLSSRELRHGSILNLKARVLGDLGHEAEAQELRAEAILMAMSDPDHDEYEADDVVSNIANALVNAGA
jgi:tetratricopeptide (TPR) repeat protein